jgi:hypothetical protein
VRVIVPTTPGSECSPNYSGGWRPKAKAVAQLRSATKYAAIRDRPRKPLEGHWRLECRICWEKRRKVMDRSNAAASLKAALDGLCDANYFTDDREVDVVVIEQLPWGKQDAGTKALYPWGCVVIDIVEVTS